MNPAADASPELAPRLLMRLRLQSQTTGVTVWALLSAHFQLPNAQCRDWLGDALNMQTMDMDALHQLKPNFEVWSYAESMGSKCLVCQGAEGHPGAVCVTADPLNLALQSRVEARLACVPHWFLAHPDDFGACLVRAESMQKAMDGALTGWVQNQPTPANPGDLSLSSVADDQSPVVRLVNSTLLDALKAEASDVHLEIGSLGLSVKFRIDGVLSQIVQLKGMMLAEQVISRIKVMAELDISERRIPQDGRFKLSHKGRDIDFRVSVMPSLFGEDVVVRILDRQSLSDQVAGLRLDHLGFDDEILAKVRHLACEPYGMLLVTGPTGSGKTTTLYAALSEIHTGAEKIITIEDPIEYQLPGILQIPVNEKKGLSFALGLRSILRHDPDKILVGEIRDSDTAHIAIQSALTGHLVFTSVHANNVFDVLGRFTHMDVDTHSFVAALNGVLAQRLMRMVCVQCAVPFAPEPGLLFKMGIDPGRLEGRSFVRGRGCGYCRGTGYKGRRAIGELLRINDELREMIIARSPMRSIKEVACAQGTRLLRDAAIDAAISGVTTLEEVSRVTFSG